MDSSQVGYRKLRHYKYQLMQDFSITTTIKPVNELDNDFISITATGELTIKGKYAWDGPSGLSVDTKTFMRGSLVHDALYQLMREGHIDFKYRAHADKLLRTICRKDGMSAVRAWYTYQGVRLFGAKYAKPKVQTSSALLVAPE